MNESLKRYLKAAGLISQEAFDLLSKYNGLLWGEISEQSNVLEELDKVNLVDESIPEKREEVIEEVVIIENGSDIEKEASITNQPDIESELVHEKGTIAEKVDLGLAEGTKPLKTEDGPVLLYNKVVSFLKNQKCDEMQWVRTYSIKHPYEGFSDFQIKYFEHKDTLHETKNYIMFGNTKKCYSIRKEGDEIIGDTSECFNIILNLSHVLNVD